MDTLTIHNLTEGLKRRLRIRAGQHNRSVEAEAREIIRQAVGEPADKVEEKPSQNLYEGIREIVEPYGGFELEIPPREPAPEPFKFDDH